MAKNNSKTLPRFSSLDKLVQFFDSHDLGEYWDSLTDVNFDVDIKRRRHLFTIDSKLAPKIAKIARLKKISSTRLINTWLREKYREQA